MPRRMSKSAFRNLRSLVLISAAEATARDERDCRLAHYVSSHNAGLSYKQALSNIKAQARR